MEISFKRKLLTFNYTELFHWSMGTDLSVISIGAETEKTNNEVYSVEFWSSKERRT